MFKNWNLQPPVIAALIAAVSAWVVAIYQAMSQRKTNASIEYLRAQLQSQREGQAKFLEHYLECFIEGREQEVQAFKDLLHHVQVLREKVARVKSNPNAYDSNILAKELTELSDNVLDAYARNQIHFNEEDRQKAHALKNMGKVVAELLGLFHKKYHRDQMWVFPQELELRERELADQQADFRLRGKQAATNLVESLKLRIEEGQSHESTRLPGRNH